MKEPSKEAMEKAETLLDPIYFNLPENVVNKVAHEFTAYQKRIEELEKIKEFMKTDLKPILAAALKAGAEFRIKSKFSPETLIISIETIGEFEEISFDPDWIKTAEESGAVVCTSRKE